MKTTRIHTLFAVAALGVASAQADGGDRAAPVAEIQPIMGLPISGHVLRNPATHVAFSPGTMSRLPPVKPGPRGLALCGDWIACPEPVLYLERACVTGLRAARALGAELGLPPGRLPAIVPQPDPAPSVAALRALLRASRRRRERPRV